MQINLSDEASRNLAAVLGTKDQTAITQIFERFAADEQLLKSLIVDDLTAEEVRAIQKGVEQAESGNVRSLEEFDSEFRARNGFKVSPNP